MMSSQVPDTQFSFADYQKWKRARGKTFLSFCILTCCLGTEYSVIIPSLWFYISDIISKGDPIKILYGTTLSIYYVAAIIGSFTITSYVDKTRKIRSTILILITCEIVGNVLYSIPLSPYFIIVGRFIQGFGDVNMSIVTAEIARSYIPSEITSKISVIVACFSTTFVMAPALNILFKYVDFSIRGFRVYFGNLPGLFMVILFTIVLVLVYVNVKDLSREFDLKQNLVLVQEFEEQENEINSYILVIDENTTLIHHEVTEQDEKDGKEKEIVTDSNNEKPYKLIKSFDFNFLVSLGFLMSFSIVAFLDVTMPIFASRYFNFNSQTTGILFFVIGLMFIIVLQLVRFLSKRFAEYYLLYIGLAIFACSTSLLLTVSLLKNTHYTFSLSIFCIYVLILGTCSCVEQVLVKSILCRLVPSSCQTFAEGVRRSASSFACITSSFITPLIIDYIAYLCVAVFALTVVSCVMLYTRKRTLTNPTVLELKDL